MNLLKSIIAASLVLALGGTAFAGLTPQEQKELGTTLTPIGAEKAGSKDGMIPPYTGGLTTPPKGYVKGSRILPDPFANEKPRFTITTKNMAQYANQLTEGTKELLKKYPDYQVEVYQTRRTAAFPNYVFENTEKNAGKAMTPSDGSFLKAPQAGFPFPIPKNGIEAMWNHLLKFASPAQNRVRAYTVDTNGRAVMSTEILVTEEVPIWQSKMTDGYFQLLKVEITGPPRRAGEAFLIKDTIDPSVYPRRAWQYLPGQRRVKMGPELGWDTPDAATNGASTHDDNWIFNGPMDRYNWKLVGKKELYVPYNNYKLAYHSKASEILKPHYINPDYVRWELHRVWVVEATLKPGKRHIYAKRYFYLDEDTWRALASDEFDARGQLFRSGFTYMTQLYTRPEPYFGPFGHYDFMSGAYSLNGYYAETGGINSIPSPQVKSWSPDALAGSGVR